MPAAAPSQKFRVDRATLGDITILTLHGVIDETFEGKKVAEGIRTKKLVANLHDVRRFASWGMAEWMDFVRATESRDLYVVECSSQAINQFSLVTGLLGHAKLVSFYIPYRCGHCSEESTSLTLVPLERAALRTIGDHEQACPTCGSTARVDRYVAAIGSTIADRPAFDIDDEVVAYLQRQLKYPVTPDVNRFRALARTDPSYTYLRLSGAISGLAPDTLAAASRNTTVLDLAGLTVPAYDTATLGPWRAYLKATTTSALQLLDCPPGFLEHAVKPEDLTKLQIRTFAVEYTCAQCNTIIAGMVDVAPNLEHLVQGELPATTCGTCKGPYEPRVSPNLSAILRRLPARPPDPALDKFLGRARRATPAQLEDGLAGRAAPAVKPPSGGRKLLWVVLAMMVLLGAGLVVIGVGVWKKQDTPVVQPVANDPGPTKPKFQRPDWIISAQPGSALCQDLLNRLVCVGVSLHRPTRAEAVADANDAALEELVHAIGLKITDPFFKDQILAAYTEPRTKALAALQGEKPTAELADADKLVRSARQRAVEALRASGGAAVPAQRTDWYWEEYALESGTGTELLVFVRYDVPMDAVKAMVAEYTRTHDALDSTLVNGFPALAWRHPEFAGGVVVVKPGASLADAGIAPAQVITKVGDEATRDMRSFAKHVTDQGELALSVIAQDGVKAIRVRR